MLLPIFNVTYAPKSTCFRVGSLILSNKLDLSGSRLQCDKIIKYSLLFELYLSLGLAFYFLKNMFDDRS